MVLNETQRDALAELINIGYGRAAGALSELTGHRVTVDVPRVELHRLDEIDGILADTLAAKVANVHQHFSGPVEGDTFLVLSEASAKTLSRMLGAEVPVTQDFDANAAEILREVGNILHGACLGTFGNLLQLQMTVSVPTLNFSHVSKVVPAGAASPLQPYSHALIVHTVFRVKSVDIEGLLVILLGVASFGRLMFELKMWEERAME